MNQPQDMTTSSGDVLPTRWPSAWPSLRGRVVLAAVFPVVACAVAVVIMHLTGVLVHVWWIAALPLLLLIGALSLPSRARSAIQSAYDGHELQVTATQQGIIVRAPRKHRGVRADATVTQTYDGEYTVRYHLG